MFSTGSHSISTQAELFPSSSVRTRNAYVPKAARLSVKSQLSDETLSQTGLNMIHDLRTDIIYSHCVNNEGNRASLTARNSVKVLFISSITFLELRFTFHM